MTTGNGYADDAIDTLYELTSELQRALIRRRNALGERSAIDEARAALDAAMADHGPLHAMVGAGDDPLDGDA